MPEYDFSNLTESQEWLLTTQGWCAGTKLFPQPQKNTVKKLIERGLVKEHKVKYGMLTLNEYEVPIDVHMAWCAHAAERERQTLVNDINDPNE